MLPLLSVFLILLLVAAPVAAGNAVEGETVARVSVTVDPDDSGRIVVPSPFAVVPGSGRVVLHVPEADGIFLLEGERILHHYPMPRGTVLHDLAATEQHLVAGRYLAGGIVTVDLRMFDLTTGASVARIESKNPHLRVGLEHEELWRAVIEGTRVGVFHPAAGATYPLWDHASGPVPSTDQLAGAKAGVGFGGETKWIPALDGSVERKHRGRTADFVGADRGAFVDAVSGDAVLLAQPRATVRADADGDELMAHELGVRLVRSDGTETDFLLDTMSGNVRATRLVIQGRPVRVHDGRIYWIFLGYDYLEIRAVPVSEIGG